MIIFEILTVSSYNEPMTLKQYIKENNKKISEISKESGIPYSTLSELANGKKKIGKCNAETVYNLAHYLNITMEELLVSENDNPYPNKYELDRTQSFFLAKKKWDENVYCGMQMEARAVTFPQTKTILEGVNVPNVSLDDILAIRNMRDAWNYILNFNDKLNLDFICKLNGYIARDESIKWGVLRTGNVGISECDYKPPIPEKEKTEGSIKRILSSYVSATEKSLDLFCFITYNQLFWDGNKRTALAAANKVLLDHGCGMMTIKDDYMLGFNERLLNMYQTGDKASLKRYLYDNAIIGLDLDRCH